MGGLGAFRQSVVIGLALSVVGCEQTLPPPPPVEVVVEAARLIDHHPRAAFVGRLQAEDDVNIQAQVSGYLLKRHFHEGETVEAGELLYEIDPAGFEAELAKAKAELASAKAAAAAAERNYSRGKQLLPKGAISEYEFDKLEAARLDSQAAVEAAQARVKAAEVDLSYTQIHAPISGRIGRSEFSAGDLVGPTSGTLTTLASIDPMQALFQVSESVYLASETRRRQYVAEQRGSGDLADIKVRIQLSDRSLYPHGGAIDYIANRVNQETGTIEARAAIPNPDGLLRPGQYVKVMLELPVTLPVVVVSQAAIQADQQGSFAMVVRSDNSIERRNVVLGERIAETVIVNQGLEQGDRVVVRGLQKIRPDQTVTVKQMPAGEA